MPIFQNSVISKYLKSQDKTLLAKRWNDYKNHFHNVTIQDNIRNSKEEQYQGEFLIDLFVAILGYTKNPQPNFNLTTEYKNVKDSKKADGAILIDDKVRAVIELKGTNTTDLGKIETQAFGYKNNQPECVYIITSNFEKLRFYIDNAIEHLEFNLFTLSEKEFELLHLCLAHENLSKGIAKSIKEESVSQEDVITKKLYKDYSLFKRELYLNLVALNPQYEPLELFKKSQKLLDRFLFIFFAEDRNLLPTNLIFRINKEWQNLRLMRIEVSLYDRYKVYFNDLNNGAKVVLPAFSETASKQIEEHQIFAYNGGLFKADEILDNIKIDDSVLFKHTENLSNYDFASEVDVNILGHIFENSLNELDEIKAQLEGTIIEKITTKRKKDGVFYTPKYITKYIVDNTIGKLCTDKKAEFKIIEEDYFTDKKRTKTTKQPLLEKLTNYRNWLLQITICDPACGSGAFLNQALDFLISEHRYIDELQAKLFGDAMVLSDVENSILENNLFGVDLNEESVEIAKLSLWLRTAQPNRKLNDLSNNIKCGNSLIDDVAIAGEKAFHWQTAFTKIFEDGGFDVIIGNPPYVSYQNNSISKDDLNYFNLNYKSSYKIFDLYGLFIEKSITLLKQNSKLSFICPSTLLMNESFSKLRKIITDDTKIDEVLFCSDGVFEDAVVPTIVFMISKSNNNSNNVIITKAEKSEIYKEKELEYNFFIRNSEEGFNIAIDKIEFNLLKKINKDSVSLEQIIEIRETIKTGNDKQFIVDKDFSTITYPLVTGKDVSRYKINQERFIHFDPQTLSRATKLEYYLKEKIFIRRVGNSIEAVIDDNNYLSTHVLYIGLLKDPNYSLQFILALLNSKLFTRIYNLKFPPKGNVFPEIRIGNLRCLPVKILSQEKQTPFVNITNDILKLNNVLKESTHKFQRTIKREFSLTELSKKLQNWHQLDYKGFLKELSKNKVNLTLSQKADWEGYFNNEKEIITQLNSKINTTDKKIDEMVYNLYELNSKEIEIIES